MAVGPSPLVRLLDVEPELASRLREDDRAEARQRLLATTHVIPRDGEGAPTAFSDAATFGRAFGFMVVDGVLLQEVMLAGRTSLQLLGPGDVVAPHGQVSALPASTRWTAATPTTVAVLDDRLQAPLALWPGLALGFIDRVAQQVQRLALLAAILQMPRVEDRLEATFWDLADRWGRVTSSGIQIPLRLTHETLARLVGGRRPTISLALTALTDRDVLLRHADGSWVLTGQRPSESLDARAEPAPSRPPAVTVAPAVDAPPRDPWLPGARDELRALTHRMADEHALSAQRVVAGRGRFEETRARSRLLRESAATQRAARQSARAAHPETLSRSRPAAPSAG